MARYRPCADAAAIACKDTRRYGKHRPVIYAELRMKLTFLQVHEAFGRAVNGESGRAIAHSLSVTEGCLRYHFRKGPSPKAVRQIAFELFYAHQTLERLEADERAAVDKLAAKRLAKWQKGNHKV